MLSMAIVGCGGIGRNHMKGYQQLEDVEVAACVDFDREKAEAMAELCGGTPLSSIEQLPRDINGVSVVTPPAAHYPVIKQLLNAGYNVFSEKPLTLTVGEAEELTRLADTNNLTLMIGFKMRFEPIFKKAKELLGEIGQVRSVSTIKQQPYNARPVGNWIPKVGAMFELSVHDFDLVHWIGGLVPEKMLAANLNYRLGWEREDAFQLTVKYKDGITGQLQGMYATDSTFLYRDLTITFLGDKGYLRIERPDRIIIHTDKYRVEEVDPGGVNAFAGELGHFRDVLLGKEANQLGGKYGIWTTWLVEEANRIYKESTEKTLCESCQE